MLPLSPHLPPLPAPSLSPPLSPLPPPVPPFSPNTGTSTGLGTGIFALPSQQQQYQQQLAVQQAIRAQLMLNAVKSPGVFPDERDMAVMKFNLLQAYCGTGRGLASYQGHTQFVDFTPDNPFCRFKVGSCLSRKLQLEVVSMSMEVMCMIACSRPPPRPPPLSPTPFPLSSLSHSPLSFTSSTLSSLSSPTPILTHPHTHTQTVCYSRLPTARNEDGLVVLQFNKSDAVLLSQQDSIIKSLQDIVGNSSVHVMVDSIRPLPDSW